MGCSTSSRTMAREPSCKKLHQSGEIKKQAEEDASFEYVNNSSQEESIVGGASGKERSPECGTEKILSPENKITEQNLDNRDGIPKKPTGLLERERQASSDILEELRMQGIIKTASATPKTKAPDFNRLVDAERSLQKPPTKLEKLEIEKKNAQS